MGVSTSRINEIYDAVKLSYNSPYDYFKYCGKTKRQYDGEKSKYYSSLLKIQAKFNTEERVSSHFAYQFLIGNPFIITCSEDAALRVTAEYEKRAVALNEYFREDIRVLSSKFKGKEGFKKLVTETEFNAPLFSLLLGAKIHFSTFAYIDSVCLCSNKWKSKVWKESSKRVLLTEQFMRITNETKLTCRDIIITELDIR